MHTFQNQKQFFWTFGSNKGNIRSKKIEQLALDMDKCYFPKREGKNNNVSAAIVLAKTDTG